MYTQRDISESGPSGEPIGTHLNPFGEPIEPTFANIFLCVHEILWLEKCPSEFRPVIYKRYVDDTFLLFQNINQIEKSNVILTSNIPISSLPLKLR